MADMHCILQVEMRGQGCQVIGIMVHVMAAAGLARPPMTAPVMRNHAITMAQKEQHLRVPIVRRKRPAMAEHDGLPAAPILVENLGAVLGGDRRHACYFLSRNGSLAVLGGTTRREAADATDDGPRPVTGIVPG